MKVLDNDGVTRLVQKIKANFRNKTDVIPLTDGGTGATTAAAARTNLEITSENMGFSPTLLYSNSNWSVTEYGKLIIVHVYDLNLGSGTWDTSECPYNIPEDFRPVNANRRSSVVATNGVSGCINVDKSNGTVYVQNLGTAANRPYSGTLVWIAGV